MKAQDKSRACTRLFSFRGSFGFGSERPESTDSVFRDLRCRYVFRIMRAPLALLRLLLSIMAGTQCGFGFSRQEVGFPACHFLIVSTPPIEVAKNCLSIA
jgi:hypothetical protein